MLRNPLPGVPSIESPFFDEIFTPEHHTENTIRIAHDLREKGYAVFDFPDADIHAKADAIKLALHGRYPWDQWNATGGGDMRIQDAWKFDENVRSLATNQKVIDLLGKLYGRQAFAFQSLNFPVGTQQHFHTDSVHFSSIPERFMCGVWVALEDVGEDQGPLEYYPGSHKWPVYANEHIGFVPRSDCNDQSTYHELWERMVAKTGLARETFHAKKGQALIWTANLLHGGSPHKDKTKTRWSQVTHFFFEDCGYYTPMFSDPFRGLIRFRRLVDITSMKPVINSFSGAPIPEVFVDAASHGFDSVKKIRRSSARTFAQRIFDRLRIP